MPGRHSIDDDDWQRPVTGGRVGPPTAGVSGSMYEFVRQFLLERGGSCTRAELVAALEANPAMRERLARSQGFAALLNNMRHSGVITVEGEIIHPTQRTQRRYILQAARS